MAVSMCGYYFLIAFVLFGAVALFLLVNIIHSHKNNIRKKWKLKLILFSISVFFILITGLLMYAWSQTSHSDLVEGRIHVEFKQNVTLEEINQSVYSMGYSILSYNYYKFDNSYSTHIRVPEGDEYFAVEEFNKLEIVEFAEVLQINAI